MSSVRKQILQALVTSFESIVAGEPDANPYPWTFDLVTRLPIGGLKAGQRAALVIIPTENSKTPTAGIIMDNNMGLTFELWLHKDTGENLPDLLEDGLATVERRLMEDQTLGGLCLDINISSLDTDIDGPFDNQAAATVTASIRYRHNRDDPAVDV